MKPTPHQCIGALALAGALAFAPSCATSGGFANKRAEAAAKADFANIVKPLFEHRCSACHNDLGSPAGLNIQSRESVFTAGAAFIVPGQPESSRVFLALTRPASHPGVMPADGWGITGEQEAALTRWIKYGAPWPEGPEGEIERKPYRVDFDDYL